MVRNSSTFSFLIARISLFLIALLIIVGSWSFVSPSNLKVIALPILRIGVDTAITGIKIEGRRSTDIIFDAGVCYSFHTDPTIFDQKTSRFEKLDSVEIALKNLAPGKAYYLRPYVITVNGTMYGPQYTFATDIPRLGAIHYGGQLRYVFKPGDKFYVENEFHGLVAAGVVRQAVWSTPLFANSLVSGLDSVVGSGPSNTSKIVFAHGQGDYAASICEQLVHRGYSDWYLPPLHEMRMMNLKGWTSTEMNSSHAYIYPNITVKKSDWFTIFAIRRF